MDRKCSCTAATLCSFIRALTSADETIKLDWGRYERQVDALDPAAKRHDQEEFLDLHISVERSQVAIQTDLKLKFQPFRKPSNAHAYLPITII